MNYMDQASSPADKGGAGCEDDPEGSWSISRFLSVGSILAAIGFVTVIKDLMTIHETVAFVIEGYQRVTHPIWDWTLGPILKWFGLPLPALVKNYLTMVVITAGAEWRSSGMWFSTSVLMDQEQRRLWRGLYWPLASFAVGRTARAAFLWPLTIALKARDHILPVYRESAAAQAGDAIVAGVAERNNGRVKVANFLEEIAHSRSTLNRSRVIFFNGFLWAAIFIAINYAFIFHDAVK